jgi:hypothetical protein
MSELLANEMAKLDELREMLRRSEFESLGLRNRIFVLEAENRWLWERISSYDEAIASFTEALNIGDGSYHP